MNQTFVKYFLLAPRQKNTFTQCIQKYSFYKEKWKTYNSEKFLSCKVKIFQQPDTKTKFIVNFCLTNLFSLSLQIKF